jgi:hypothetical protein
VLDSSLGSSAPSFPISSVDRPHNDFDLQQLEACTQELQHILGDSLLKSSPVIVRLKNTRKRNTTALLALMESLKNARTARTIMLRVILQTQKAEPYAGLSDSPNSLQGVTFIAATPSLVAAALL